MKTWAVNILSVIIFIFIGWFANVAWNLPKDVNPVAVIKPHPLLKYTIEELTSVYPKVVPSDINIVGELQKSKNAPKTGLDFTPYEFKYSFDPSLSNGTKKTVSGLINIPKGPGPFPLIIMVRGFVDQEQYFIGEGTQHSAEVFASEGFITIAPDFLGYGDSDKESSDIFESRFQTYTTLMTLIRSVNSVQSWDGKNVFIWAHSNGGQIVLTDLETTGVNYPTVLWAPNSARFPYSILYYLDEASDSGKLIVTKLAEFMADYDVTKYAFNNYLGNIKAPIQIDQGTADDAVPPLWNETLSKNLTKSGVDVKLIKYPGADHNLTPGWNEAVQNDLNFFKEHLVK